MKEIPIEALEMVAFYMDHNSFIPPCLFEKTVDIVMDKPYN